MQPEKSRRTAKKKKRPAGPEENTYGKPAGPEENAYGKPAGTEENAYGKSGREEPASWKSGRMILL
jgi:hypothetical protein